YLPERLEAREVGARRTALHHDVEQVAARDPDHAHESVEQAGDEHRGDHARYHEPLNRVDPEDLHRVELLADLPRAEVGADRRATGPGDHERGDDRPGLADDGEHGSRTGERLRAELAYQRPELQRDHRAERDRHEPGRQDRHRADEPRLLDQLAYLERPARYRLDGVDREREQVPGTRHHGSSATPSP